MESADDVWWLGAIVLLVGLWVMEVAIPVAIAKPVFAMAGTHADEDAAESAQEVQRPQPLGPAWPITGAVLSCLFTIGVMWRCSASGGERRWMWMSVAGMLTATWALTLIVIAQRAAHHLAGG